MGVWLAKLAGTHRQRKAVADMLLLLFSKCSLLLYPSTLSERSPYDRHYIEFLMRRFCGYCDYLDIPNTIPILQMWPERLADLLKTIELGIEKSEI